MKLRQLSAMKAIVTVKTNELFGQPSDNILLNIFKNEVFLRGGGYLSLY